MGVLCILVAVYKTSLAKPEGYLIIFLTHLETGYAIRYGICVKNARLKGH